MPLNDERCIFLRFSQCRFNTKEIKEYFNWKIEDGIHFSKLHIRKISNGIFQYLRLHFVSGHWKQFLPQCWESKSEHIFEISIASIYPLSLCWQTKEASNLNAAGYFICDFDKKQLCLQSNGDATLQIAKWIYPSGNEGQMWWWGMGTLKAAQIVHKRNK